MQTLAQTSPDCPGRSTPDATSRGELGPTAQDSQIRPAWIAMPPPLCGGLSTAHLMSYPLGPQHHLRLSPARPPATTHSCSTRA